jgi:hypothetical protein
MKKPNKKIETLELRWEKLTYGEALRFLRRLWNARDVEPVRVVYHSISHKIQVGLVGTISVFEQKAGDPIIRGFPLLADSDETWLYIGDEELGLAESAISNPPCVGFKLDPKTVKFEFQFHPGESIFFIKDSKTGDHLALYQQLEGNEKLDKASNKLWYVPPQKIA